MDEKIKNYIESKFKDIDFENLDDLWGKENKIVDSRSPDDMYEQKFTKQITIGNKLLNLLAKKVETRKGAKVIIENIKFLIS
jgi:hypothetical protein